jgi:hypothetical protein
MARYLLSPPRLNLDDYLWRLNCQKLENGISLE